jgi:inhibitor of KinA
MKWIPYGPDAWLLQFAGHLDDKVAARGRAIACELERRPVPGLLEYVVAFTTVLFEFAPGTGSEAVRRALGLRLSRAARGKLPRTPVKEIPVCYDGPDLERVAAHHGLEIKEVIERHLRPIYQVYALGFSPGFPYLGQLDSSLHTPRLASPRARVAAGSVAIGGAHTGIYSVDGPGGWNIIGRTSVKLFTGGAWEPGTPPGSLFLLHPGDRVRFLRVHTPPGSALAQ